MCQSIEISKPLLETLGNHFGLIIDTKSCKILDNEEVYLRKKVKEALYIHMYPANGQVQEWLVSHSHSHSGHVWWSPQASSIDESSGELSLSMNW